MSHPRRPLQCRLGLIWVTAAVLALPAARAGAAASGALPTAASAAGRGAVEQALQAVARASAEARQSASAAAAAADRIAALERAVDQLRQEAQSSRVEAEGLREQLGRVETPLAVWVLGALASGLALLAAWLARWMPAGRRADRAMAGPNLETQNTRPFTADATPDRPLKATTSGARGDVAGAVQATARSRPPPAWPPPAPLDATQPQLTPRAEPRQPKLAVQGQDVVMATATAVQSGDNTLPVGQESEAGSHPVSIDELLDLEQQADFFVVLGQDDAAIELLVEHLRHTGGGSPLPYLKLLEIHRRRGDQDDYERTRARFNRRFNAYAPEWGVELQAGRNLGDYAGVIPRLQQVWSRPLDSMAELEAMMFRRSQGELFDLPAYREILFLYALSRDLLDRESAETGQVDLLLPLADGSEFSSTSPTPFLEMGRDAQRAPADFEDKPTAPVDLDLSCDGERATSIFDPLGESPTRSWVR